MASTAAASTKSGAEPLLPSDYEQLLHGVRVNKKSPKDGHRVRQAEALR